MNLLTTSITDKTDLNLEHVKIMFDNGIMVDDYKGD